MKVGVVQAVKNRRPVVPTAMREIRPAPSNRRQRNQGGSVNNGVVH
jgi:hypothetical protein